MSICLYIGTIVKKFLWPHVGVLLGTRVCGALRCYPYEVLVNSLNLDVNSLFYRVYRFNTSILPILYKFDFLYLLKRLSDFNT